MDLYIDRNDLSRGLARIQGVIERRSTFPMLAHVLIEAHVGGLRMTATDTEVAYTGELPANVQKPGSIAVDAASLFQIVRALPDPLVRLASAAGNRLDVSSGRSQFRLPGAPASDFPPLPAFVARGTARLPESALRRLVDQTSYAVAAEDHRFGLNGAHLEERVVDGLRTLRVVATDGHRLSAAESSVDGDLATLPRKQLVPRKALGVIRKLLEGDGGTVEVEFGDGAIRLVRPGHVFWFRLLDGDFPEYEEIVPKAGKHRALIDREELSATLKRVAILTQDRARAVKFSFSPDTLDIHVHNVDRGEITESLPIELEGDPIAVGFNVRYLQDILASTSGEQVEISMAHNLAPCLITDPAAASDAFFVAMPMRLD